MTLYHSQTQRHMINEHTIIWVSTQDLQVHVSHWRAGNAHMIHVLACMFGFSQLL